MTKIFNPLVPPYFNQKRIEVYYKYPPSQDFAITFTNPGKKIFSKVIVDEYGNIINFPGFEHPQLINYYLEDVSDKPIVRFSARIKSEVTKHLFLWEIQPDGRYWEDEDGFGMGKGDETVLYTYLDNRGDFISKFKLYRVGSKSFFDNDLEEKQAEALKKGEYF